MLRALAGYFFGGPQDEAPQEQVECETKEVNDWLVVNMPDQPEDDIDFEEEAGDGDEMEIEDMDEILHCLSNWFTIEELENKPTFSDDKKTVEQSSLPRIQLLFTQDNSPREEFNLNLKRRTDSLSLVPRPPWHSWLYLMPMQARFKQISESMKNKPAIEESNLKVDEAFWKDNTLRSVLGIDSRSAKEMFQQRLKERNGKKVVKTSDVTCHPVYSKTYVNHRHPALSPPKTDLLQKIKDLEPEQRATQHAMKKHISRGQINRQNKNYIYETSTKKNRRKNLQRNPSGANNNRKCCY